MQSVSSGFGTIPPSLRSILLTVSNAQTPLVLGPLKIKHKIGNEIVERIHHADRHNYDKS